jgi:hypothetical protein
MATSDLLEHQPFWPEVLRHKDALPLRDLAVRFRTSPGAISAAFKRTGTVRVPPQPSSDVDLDTVTPEPPLATPSGGVLPEVAAAIARIRPGSKDSLIAQHATALGQLPDAEVARLAGVSVRTIASFRARHQIPGYRGPRRLGGGKLRGSGLRAWKVVWYEGDERNDGVLVAASLSEAWQKLTARTSGEVVEVSLVGPWIDDVG